jgi:hypothetical protein
MRTVGETRSCEKLSYRGDKKNTPGAPVGIMIDALGEFFCFSNLEEFEQKAELITFEGRSSQQESAGIKAEVQSLVALSNGTEVGSVSTLRAKLLSPLPFLFAGCGLVSSRASWECGVQLARDTIDWPSSDSTNTSFAGQQAFQTDRVAKLLSLKPRSFAISRLPKLQER